MAFVLQDDTGLVVDANAYLSVADFKTYFTDRGDEASAELDDAVIQASIIEATSYIDTRFCYKGLPLNSVVDGQNTQFPRSSLFDARGDRVEGLPKLLKDACAEYAKREAASPLYSDPEVSDNRGQVTYTREKVEGAVEEETHYAEGISVGSLKPYPAADQLLAQYIAAGGLIRA